MKLLVIRLIKLEYMTESNLLVLQRTSGYGLRNYASFTEKRNANHAD